MTIRDIFEKNVQRFNQKGSISKSLILTGIAYVLVNLPLLWGLIFKGLETVTLVWGLHPNQFFFLVAVFPFAAGGAFYAMVLLQRTLKDADKSFRKRIGALSKPAFFKITFLVGLCFALIIAIADDFGSTRSLDFLCGGNSAFGAKSLREVLDRYEAEDSPALELNEKGKTDAAEVARRLDGFKGDCLDVEAELQAYYTEKGDPDSNVKAFTCVHLLFNEQIGSELPITSLPSRILQGIELAVSMFTAWTLIVAVICLFWISRCKQSITGNIRLMVSSCSVSLAAFWVFPFAMKYHLGEVNAAIGSGVFYSIGGDLWATVILCTVTFILILAFNQSNFLENTLKIVPMIIGAAGIIWTRINPETVLQLRRLIGYEANWSFQLVGCITVFVCLSLFAGVIAIDPADE